MKTFNASLPPLLERELDQALTRYRRLRVLRAAMKFFALLLCLCALAAPVLFWASLPHALLVALLTMVVVLSGLWAFWPVVARPVSLREIAAHIDRQHPDLQDRVLSAVVLAESSSTAPSAWMLEHFLADTQQRVRGIPLDDFMRPWELRLLAGGVAVCGLLCLAGGLTAAWKLGIIRSYRGAETAGPIRFEVKPGNAVVQPGDNPIIWVTTPDTTAARHIFWTENGVEHRALLQPSTTPEVSYHTFNALQESVQYQVRVGDVDSDRFEIRVHRPPAVSSIQAHYVYPTYLGMADAVVPYAGDLNGVEGTRVTLRVEVNKPLESVRLLREAGEALSLQPAGERLWETSFALTASDTYRLALRDIEGAENPDPESHAIEVIPDHPPEIRIRFPRGDAKVLALEEVPFAFEVEDDFGIEAYGIEYTPAGRAPVRVALNPPGEPRREASAEHLLPLEDLGLAEGDLITWSAWATDRKPGRAEFETSGDPYFLEVRPYTLRFREQLSQGGGQGPAGAGDAALDQKKIIVALTNLRKAAQTLSEAPYNEQRDHIVESQAAIRDRLSEGLANADATQQQIGMEGVAAMDEVLQDLGGAHWPDPEVALGAALAPAQRAWQAMLKLEPALREVARQEGGGGSAGQSELDALEMGQRKDYLEEATTGTPESEPLRNALDDLARRQELLNEDLGKLITEEAQANPEEEKKRQLERLKEEQQRQLERLDALRNQLAAGEIKPAQRDATRATLDQAREAMERSMESVREEALQEARASGSRAAQDLAEAGEALKELTREGARERFTGLERQIADLQHRQAALQEEVKSLNDTQAAPGVEGQDDFAVRTDQLKDDKNALAEAMKGTLEDAGGFADALRENEELLSRKLGDWTRRTSQTGLVEDMREGLPLVEYGVWEVAMRQEQQVKEKLDEAARTLGALRSYLPGEQDDAMARALAMLEGLEQKQDGPTPSDEPAAPPTTDSDAATGAATETSQPPAGAAGDAAAPNGATPGAQGNGASPGGDGDEGPGGPMAGTGSFDNFFDGEARAWRPVLRDAAALLPRESEMREALERVETDLGRLQREYDHSKQLPDVGEFEQVVRRPLMDTISTLEAVIRAKASGEASWLEDEGAIPEQYVDRVAEYFRLLAQEAAQP